MNKKIYNAMIMMLIMMASICSVVLINHAVSRVDVSVKSVAAIRTPISSLSLWTDSSATTPLTSIDWGTFNRGETKEITGPCVRNDGEVGLRLSMSTSDWVPAEASNWISLDWNYESWILPVGEIHKMQFLLTVSADTPANITNFSFEITIGGTEVVPSGYR